MYQSHLLSLSKEENHLARLGPESVLAERRNPACGDELALGHTLRDGTLCEIRFHIRACAVTRASATALAHAIDGIAPKEARARATRVLRYLEGDGAWEEPWGQVDMAALGEVRAFPLRIACARLPWLALLDSLPPVTS